MRLGVVYDPDLPNCNYRAMIPMSALERRGHEIVWTGVAPGDTTVTRLFGCDLVHFHRQYGPQTREAIIALRTAGVAVSYDNDDDLDSIPPESPFVAEYGPDEGPLSAAAVLDAARLATLVTTPSPLLVEKYRRAGIERIEVIDNYLPEQWAGEQRRPHDGIVVGWTAGLTHAVDDLHLGISQALARVLDANPEVSVVSVGHRLDLRHDRYRHIESVLFADLIHLIAEFDIGIAPLADVPFNRARSTVKLKEYAILGVPWLGSPVGPYRELGANEGGQLVADGEWEVALDALIADAGRRKALGRAGASWARRQTSDFAASRWEEAFARAVRDASAAPGVPAA